MWTFFPDPEWRRPMSVPHERFHRTLSLEFFKTNSYILKWSASKKNVNASVN